MNFVKSVIIFMLVIWELDNLVGNKEYNNNIDKLTNVIIIVVGAILPFVIMKL